MIFQTNLVASFHRHPLHIYLNEYLKAITAYEAALQDLKKLQRLYEQTREDVWKITDNRVAETGKCGDNKTVTGEQFYRQCHLNKIALAELETHLESIRHFLYDTSFGFKCTAELARFQVECFLFDVIRGNPVTGGLQDDAPTTSRSDWLKVPETAEIRVCVSILFAFHRLVVYEIHLSHFPFPIHILSYQKIDWSIKCNQSINQSVDWTMSQ